MNIAANIRRLREERGMEQQELAEKLNISNKTISSWECGRTEPRMGMIEAMCAVFGCKKTELIDGEKPHSTDAELIEYAKRLSVLSSDDLENVMQYIDFLSKKKGENG